MSAHDPNAPASCPPPASCCPVARPRGVLVLAVLVLAALYLWTTRQVPASFAWTHDLQAGLDQAVRNHQLVLVEFGSPGCSACGWMDRQVFSKPKVAEALKDWIPVEVDGDKEPHLSAPYGIIAYPTYLVLSPRGQALARLEGTLPIEEFIGFLRSAQDEWRNAPAVPGTQPAPGTQPG